ncbi:hypothetical protein [Anaerovorax sp. IOR16]|uniref:hypothetical protein n=1 Tax=Anaerovorax sp. IOR16 TaxID=2773458 RepID=UPI0019D0AC56|nr:hypothetical protein [Anaerovorax sp. IOR16]
MINIDKLIITEIDKITGFNNANELELIMDELTDATISNTEEKVDVTGRGGRKIASLKKNKAVIVKGTNGLLVGGALAAMTGGTVTSGTNKIRTTDIITVTGNAGVTQLEAKGVTGAEIGTLYKKTSTGAMGEKIVQVASGETLKTGEFTYNPTTKALAFFTGDLTDGSEVVGFYDVEVESAKVSNESDKYSKVLKLYIDVTCQDNCDNMYHGQFIFNRADFNGTFDITMGKDPSTQAFEAESLAGGCTGGNQLWDFIVFQ